MAELLAKHQIQATKKGTLWSPADLQPNTSRANRNILTVSCFVADLDGEPFADDLRDRLANVAYIAHTTFSHTDESPHWRLVIPLAAPVAAADWATVWQTLCEWLDAKIDMACKEPSRAYFLPAHLEGAKHETLCNLDKPHLDHTALPNTPQPHTAPQRATQRHTTSLSHTQRPSDDILADPINEAYKNYMANRSGGRHAAMISAVQSLANIAALAPLKAERCLATRDQIGKQFVSDVTADKTRTLLDATKELADAISSAETKAAGHHTDTRLATSKTAPPNLPTEFWASRPTLTQIRQAAHAAYVSADVVLGCVLARIATQTHWSIKIPNIGTRSAGSLNIFVAPVGDSGTSKSSAYRVAEKLIPDPGNENIWLGAPLGSGEGLIEAFLTTDTIATFNEKNTKQNKTVKRQTKDGVLFHLDEGAAFDQLGDRKGTTLKPTLRQAWNAETLGQTNASQETRRYLAAHHYRLSLIMSFQPAYTEHLLSESDAGTPQRFIWLSATDPNINPANKHTTTTPLAWLPPQTYGMLDQYTTQTLDIDPTIIAELETRSLAKVRGQLHTPAMESHRDLQHMKTAALLAILDGRLNITRHDWHLANTLLDTSRTVWESCQTHINTKASNRNAAADTRAINRTLQTDEAIADRALNNMARNIARKVHANPEPTTKRDAQRATSSVDRSRASVEDAIKISIEKGWITPHGDTYNPGESTPT